MLPIPFEATGSANEGIPEMGMTEAMTPETGSHAIIQISTNLRNVFMFIGQA